MPAVNQSLRYQSLIFQANVQILLSLNSSSVISYLLLFTLHELVRVCEAKKKEVWVTQNKTGEGMAPGHQGMYPSPPAVVPK